MVWATFKGKRSIFHFKSHSEHFIKSEFPIHFHGKTSDFVEKVIFLQISQNRLNSWFGQLLRRNGPYSISKAILNISSNPSSRFIFMAKTSDFVEKVKFLAISQNRLNSWFGQLLRGNGPYSISKAILNISSNPSSRFIFMAKTSDFVEKVKFLEISQNRLNSWFGQLLRGNGPYSISKAILNISSNPSSRFTFMAKRQIS